MKTWTMGRIGRMGLVVALLACVAQAYTWAPGAISTNSPNWQIVDDLTNNFMALDHAVQADGGAVKLRGSALIAGSVSNAAIADHQITSAKIADATIVDADIAVGTITSQRLASAVWGEVASKSYVIAATNTLASQAYAAGRVSKGGDTMGGALSISLIKSTNESAGESSTLTLQGADGVAGGDVVLRSGNTSQQVVPGSVSIYGGVSADGVYTGSVVIANVAAPTLPGHAVSKAYADGLTNGMGLAGGLLSSPLQVAAGVYISGTNPVAGSAGPLTVRGGDAPAGNGGSLLLRGGNAAGQCGSVTVQGGDSGPAGGSVVVRGGRGTYTTGTVTITEVVTPTSAGDAANKSYVDARVLRAGDVMTGVLQTMSDVSGTNISTGGGDAGPLTVRGGDTVTGKGGDLTLRGGDETSMGGYGGNVVIRGGNTTAGLGGNVDIIGGVYGGGGQTGDVTILGLPLPTEGHQAASKAYVDALSTMGTAQFIALTNALKQAGVF